jgi:hypothetical protein
VTVLSLPEGPIQEATIYLTFIIAQSPQAGRQHLPMDAEFYTIGRRKTSVCVCGRNITIQGQLSDRPSILYEYSFIRRELRSPGLLRGE